MKNRIDKERNDFAIYNWSNCSDYKWLIKACYKVSPKLFSVPRRP